MATYEEIYGKRVDVLSSDPTLTSANEGQVWYNSTSGTLKTVVASAAWSSGSPLGTARYALGGAGTQDAALGFGGAATPPFATQTLTEEYNGSGWAAGGVLGTARYVLGGCGTQTAALAFGGNYPARKNETEEYNGTSWTAGGVLTTARRGLGSAGTQAAAAAFGGDVPPGTTTEDATEEYDGTSWTAGGDLNTARALASGGYVGTQSATFIAGGLRPDITEKVEEYNGTSWTDVTGLPADRSRSGVAGSQTDAIVFGGALPALTNTTFKYDGTSWTAAPSLGTAVNSMGGAGTATAGLSFGGNVPGTTAATEEYNFGSNTITAAAFSSQTGPTSPVYAAGTGGTPTAAFLVAGFGCGPNPSAHKITNQHYDGSSWSEAADINSGRFLVGAAGTQTASLVFGGRAYPSPPTNDLTEEFDGSSWTVGNVLNTARQFGASCGTQTAALGTGGSATQANEEYDGTSWTSVTNYPLSTDAQLRTTGIQTAAITSGGPPSSTATNTYDGTNWTAAPDMVAVVQEGNLNGTTSSAIHAGGNFGGAPHAAQSQIFDSTTWTTGANLGTGREAMPSGPSSTTSISGSLMFGGPIGAPTYNANQLEEYTGETSAINAKTLTTG